MYDTLLFFHLLAAFILAVTVVIWTLGEMIYAPVTGAFVTGLAPERFRGRYMGLWHSTWSAGLILGPLMGTWLYEKNPNALWVACLFVGGLSSVLALVKPQSRLAAQHQPEAEGGRDAAVEV